MDVHAFDPAEPLRLGGLDWPGQPGLAGHSDGDAIAHAICDALLSAAALGDLGEHFGVDRPEWAGRSGADFLARTLELVAAEGWHPVNVAVQVIAQRPAIAPRRAELQQRLGQLVGAPVSVAGTTTDRLGFLGRAEGLSVVATALLRRDGGAAADRGGEAIH